MKRGILSALLLAFSLTAQADGLLSGEQAFAACAGCHSIAESAAHKVGPNLYAVAGAAAASRDGYSYSPALREAGITWSREQLFAWIAASEYLVPGSWMLYENTLRPEEVQSLIDFLIRNSPVGATEVTQ